MIKIGLIDDRKKEREDIKERLLLELEKLGADWTVNDYEPFEPLEAYQQWLRDEKIDVLIVDEKLNEQSQASTAKVPFTGHQLIEVIRSYNKTLPIFVITSFSDNPDLLSTAGNIDNIIDRIKFAKYSEQYVQTMIRVSNKYLQTFENEFTRLSELSEKIATGTAAPAEIDQAKALQAKLYLPFSINPLVERENAIEEFETQVKDLDNLRKKIDDFLKK